MKRVFIDGSSGTVGLLLSELLQQQPEFSLLTIDGNQRRDTRLRQMACAEADAVVLCLPRAAAAEAAAVIPAGTRVIDAGSNHRLDRDWCYGLPELTPEQSAKIAGAERVANPGCFATAAILALRPLVDAEIVGRKTPPPIFATSGYTAGGHSMIKRYEAGGSGFTQHHVGLTHRHIPEIQHYAGLTTAPVFLPATVAEPEGLLVMFAAPSGTRQRDVLEVLGERYAETRFVDVRESISDTLTLPSERTNRVTLVVAGTERQPVVMSGLNNLMKGAAGAVCQNLRLMLGLEDTWEPQL